MERGQKPQNEGIGEEGREGRRNRQAARIKKKNIQLEQAPVLGGVIRVARGPDPFSGSGELQTKPA